MEKNYYMIRCYDDTFHYTECDLMTEEEAQNAAQSHYNQIIKENEAHFQERADAYLENHYDIYETGKMFPDEWEQIKSETIEAEKEKLLGDIAIYKISQSAILDIISDYYYPNDDDNIPLKKS